MINVELAVIKKLKNVSKSVLFMVLLVGATANARTVNTAIPLQGPSGLATQPRYSSPFSRPENVQAPSVYPSTEGYLDDDGYIFPSQATSAAAIYSLPGEDAQVADRIPRGVTIAPSTAATDRNRTVPGTAPMSPGNGDRGTVSGSTSN